MLHLPSERLAELGDAAPDPGEAAHLATCEVCAHERHAYQALVAMAHAERAPFGLPLTRWDAIAAELSHAAPAPALTHVSVQHSRRWRLQVAAGLLLLAGGAMAGRMSAGARAFPEAGSAPSGIAASTAVATPGDDARPAGLSRDDSVTFASAEEARTAQQRSEQVYEQAAAFLARVDSTAAGSGSPVAYRSRLAALDRVISTTREAMRDAPHDPVINGYYLTTLGQREATLRQLNTALPASLRVNSF
ncbi:MAG: hypothetical protein ABJA80_11635 [bacterium]